MDEWGTLIVTLLTETQNDLICEEHRRSLKSSRNAYRRLRESRGDVPMTFGDRGERAGSGRARSARETAGCAGQAGLENMA